MKKIADLNAEMISKISSLKKCALEGVSDGKRYQNFNTENAIKCIEWNYKKCGYRKPVIIVTENPLEMQMMFNFVKALDEESKFSNLDSRYPELFAQLGEQNQSQFQTPFGFRLQSILRSRLGSRATSSLNSNFLYQLDDQLCAQLYSKMFAQLECQLAPELSSELGHHLRSELRFMLGDQLGDAVDEMVDDALAEQISGLGEKHLSYLFTTNFYSDCIYTWYEFLRNDLQLDLSVDEDFQECFKLQKGSGICQAIYSEELCVISKYPKQIHWNDEHQLHNEFSQAIEWGSYSEVTQLDCAFVNGEAISSIRNLEMLSVG